MLRQDGHPSPSCQSQMTPNMAKRHPNDPDDNQNEYHIIRICSGAHRVRLAMALTITRRPDSTLTSGVLLVLAGQLVLVFPFHLFIFHELRVQKMAFRPPS